MEQLVRFASLRTEAFPIELLRHSFFFLLSSQLSRRTSQETLDTQDALHTISVPSSSGMFVHKLLTSIDTKMASWPIFVFSMKRIKSVVSFE